jgi:hypothetical protein
VDIGDDDDEIEANLTMAETQTTQESA